MNKKISILSTRPIDKDLVAQAATANIFIQEQNFIDTIPVRSADTIASIQKIAQQKAYVVFTSMNAVEAVAQVSPEQLDWKIYAIGYATKRLIENNWGKQALVGTADNATMLAHQIVADGNTQKVVFFCGKQRRDELPQMLKENHIDVDEIVVYETIAMQQKIDQPFDAILFFSPSAVESFFSSNALSDQTILFAIGQTTATTIQQYCSNHVVVSNEPGKDQLVQTMLQFYATNK